MIEWPFIFLGGLLGSSHCVGMCGGFAVSIGVGARNLGDNLRRQAIYSLGRLFTYSFLGSISGFAGLWMVHRTASFVNLQAALSVVAGLFLGYQGLLALGAIPRPSWRILGRPGPPCLAGEFAGTFLTSPRRCDLFLAGLWTGFLPCGLVYGYLALATSSASVVSGLTTMALFGAGTVPIMTLTGAGASLLSLTARRRLYRVAAVCVFLTGLLTLARGIFAFEATSSICCPLCEPSVTAS
jgi:uncharacterized protein